MTLTLESLSRWPLEELVGAVTDERLDGVRIEHAPTFLLASSNDRIALQWAARYLSPTMVVTSASHEASAAQYLHVGVDEATLRAIFALVPPGEPFPLQMRRLGDRVDVSDERSLIRDPEGPMLYVVDRAANRVLAIANTTPTNVRDLARQARELLLSDALRDGWIVMHGSAVACDGVATVFLGNKGAGKSSIALAAAELRGCSYISNDRVLLKSTPEGIRVRPYAMSVRLGGGTLLTSDALRPHLHAYDHLQAALLPLEEQFAHTDKLELCLDELAAIVRRDIELEAILSRVVLPRLDVTSSSSNIAVATAAVEHDALLAEALFTPDPDGNGWLRDLLHGAHPADQQTVSAVREADAIEITGSSSAIVHLLFPSPAPSSRVSPERWLRDAQEATLVCVMDHYRSERRLELAPWRTRAVQGGSVHEILLTPDLAGDAERADEIHYLGFAAFSPGLLCVGDEVVLDDGRVLGTLAGFDDTHLPNHMNIVISSDLRATGVALGATVGSAVHFRPAPPA